MKIPIRTAPSSVPPLRALVTLDDRQIAAMRFVLATSGLLITIIDPAAPDRLMAVTYAVLSLYVAYSALLCILAVQLPARSSTFLRWAYWLDVGWYSLLIALSSGTSSIFFFGFLFAILVAPFRSGLHAGLAVTLASVVLFTVVGFATRPVGPDFELNRFLLRPIFLLVLGYMMAYWGGLETTLKRRLALLKEVSALSNPRFGVDRTIGTLLEQVRRFYDAETCLWISTDPLSGERQLRQADRQDPEGGTQAVPLGALAAPLLPLPGECAVIYEGPPRGWRWWPLGGGYRAYDSHAGASSIIAPHLIMELAATFDVESFITVPLHYHGVTTGRLYLTAGRWRAFSSADVEFLLQVVEQVTPVIDNVRLVDQLASEAAEEERRRIARDLHDSVIQPYIGLQIGLVAVRHKLNAGANVTADLDQLTGLTESSIGDLRAYIGGLRTGGEHDGSLLPALRRFSSRLTQATNIAIDVVTTGDLRLNDRLSAEIFQMIAEGLSNVRRHTSARQASVTLERRDNHVRVTIENKSANGDVPTPFTPRSIIERARALGGQARVVQREDATSVIIEIPL